MTYMQDRILVQEHLAREKEAPTLDESRAKELLEDRKSVV